MNNAGNKFLVLKMQKSIHINYLKAIVFVNNKMDLKTDIIHILIL